MHVYTAALSDIHGAIRTWERVFKERLQQDLIILSLSSVTALALIIETNYNWKEEDGQLAWNHIASDA